MTLVEAIKKLENPHDPYNKDLIAIRTILNHLLTVKEAKKEKKVEEKPKRTAKVWVGKTKKG